MFINNGKSLFGNTGLIISILILIILVYFSYNNCYINNKITNSTNNNNNNSTNSIETFDTSFLPPKNLRITINNSDVIVNFSIDNTTTNLLPTSFIILLAQYDINKKNTGNNNFYLSNETILNPGLKSSNIETHTCIITDGIPQCKYVFNDVESKDENNNLYYYKVGVAAIYSNGESNYATPYNISNPDKLFTLDTSLNNQNKLVPSNTIKPITPNTISTADGKYELIKSQLGNYPDNLLLDTQTINNNSLSDLVDKSMAQALLNVNIST